jgi:tetratricopeptide (TPR) repeat protein
MMKKHIALTWILMLIMLLVSGCSSLQYSVQELKEIRSFLDSAQTPAKVTDRARNYREQGELIKALSLLQASKGKFPENAEINRLLLKYERDWRQQQLSLEKQLLLIETRRLVESIPLLEKLAKGHPNNQLIETRILLWQTYLESKVPDLVECGIVLEEENIWLARRCLSMAYRISRTPESKQRLDTVTKKIEAIQRAAREKLEQQEARRRAERIKQLLSEVRQDRQQGALVNAMMKIDEALKQDPESSEVREELAGLQEQLGRQVDILMKLGDKLYRNQQTGAAVAVWEAALKLDPNQQQVTERILRARTVLNKLESIRSTTQPSTP